MNKSNLEVLYTKGAASGFDDITDIINSLHDLLKSESKKVKWHQDRELSYYGFNLLSMSGKYSLFFGMFWHFWSDIGYPFCIYLDTTTGKISDDDERKFRLFCEKDFGLNCKYYNYNGFNVCALSIDFICQDLEVIKKTFYNFYLNIQLINK